MLLWIGGNYARKRRDRQGSGHRKGRWVLPVRHMYRLWQGGLGSEGKVWPEASLQAMQHQRPEAHIHAEILRRRYESGRDS